MRPCRARSIGDTLAIGPRWMSRPHSTTWRPWPGKPRAAELPGYGYHDTITPPVVLRNILENPAGTRPTRRTRLNAQGRLEALLNYQTMVQDLTGLEIANHRCLMATAVARRTMAHRTPEEEQPLLGRRQLLPLDHRGPHDPRPTTRYCRRWPPSQTGTRTAVLRAPIQYPSTDGSITDFELVPKFKPTRVGDGRHRPSRTHHDRSAGHLGADIAIGNSQRFGVPLGYGGPHAAFMATREKHKRQMPGRIIGVSKDRHGNVALRMALQTREQHIRRDRATSNICTAQVLLGVCAGMYACGTAPTDSSALPGACMGLPLALRGFSPHQTIVLHEGFFSRSASTWETAAMWAGHRTGHQPPTSRGATHHRCTGRAGHGAGHRGPRRRV